MSETSAFDDSYDPKTRNPLQYKRSYSRVHGKRVLTHRLVMAEKLGRELLPNENVHHLNGNRSDNRPENLELWSISQPAGQRPEDKIVWALEILTRYDPESLA